MDKELKEMLTCINENLKAVVTNQSMMYCRIKKIEERVERSKNDSGYIGQSQ